LAADEHVMPQTMKPVMDGDGQTGEGDEMVAEDLFFGKQVMFR